MPWFEMDNNNIPKLGQHNFPLTAILKSQFSRFYEKRGPNSNFIFLASKRQFIGGNDV